MFTLRIAVVACLFCLPLSMAWARVGYVETRDGRVLEGHVRFESNAVVVVNAAKELWAIVPLTNIAGVTLESGRAPAAVVVPMATPGTGGLPNGWQSEDIGSVRHTGGTELRRGVFRVRSSGTNALGVDDSAHFVFKTVRGRSEIVARVTKVDRTDPWAGAGLMMRESLAAGARNIFLAVTAARGGVFSRRTSLGEDAEVSLDAGVSVPCWLKLRRDGDVFTALRSVNGQQWTELERLKMSAAKEMFVGLAVVAVRGDRLNESVFEQVEEGLSLRNRWFVPQVELKNGSAQVGYITSMDDAAVRFETAAWKDEVSRPGVANVRFQPVPSRWAAVLNAGRAGVLLNTGEFIDGECRGIREHGVVLSSVPLGLVRYDVNSEVIALVLGRRGSRSGHGFEVRMADGSNWLGTELQIDEGGVWIRVPMMGARRVAIHEVSELRRRS